MYTIGIDIGSSSVKATILDVCSGEKVSSAFFPKDEMEIESPNSGYAEQNPDVWWENMKLALNEALEQGNVNKDDIKAIGISYQMHGLVVLDKNGDVLRNSIIWCDSRAVAYGDALYEEVGQEKCLSELLNSPGNFTFSKLLWIKENEPEVYEKIDKIMLPGDYINFRLTGENNTTMSGLSEGIMWNFSKNEPAELLFEKRNVDKNFIPDVKGSFDCTGHITQNVSEELGLPVGIPVNYRSGDQPNNALSLNVFEPGEIAATAGTSGVVYAVTDELKYDEQSRVNIFAHVNHSEQQRRLGVLLCINGTGIMNSWLRKNVISALNYEEMNDEAATVPIGSDGLLMYPFGNGAERVLGNKNPKASMKGLEFNIHTQAHLLRAAQEGIAFSFKYGVDAMLSLGVKPKVIRAGEANMFLSPVFRQTIANILNCPIELYDTDGALGAARAAAYGAGLYNSLNDAFSNLNLKLLIEPKPDEVQKTQEVYEKWINAMS